MKRLWTGLMAMVMVIVGLYSAPLTARAEGGPALFGTVHVQTIGDMEELTSPAGQVLSLGTTGRSLRLENIRLRVQTDSDLHILYRTHVQSIGWMDWASDGEVSGTSGHSKRLEAIQIQLTGADAANYDIYYRSHAQRYGWLKWAKNGEISGTSGQSLRLEGLQVVLVKKGGTAPEGSADTNEICIGSASAPAEDITVPHIVYSGHCQTYGDQLPKSDGATLGITGESKRLEAFSVRLTNLGGCGLTGGVTYKVCVEGEGWQSERENGSTAGTMGRAKKLEAMNIALTGDIAKHYDVRYRAHIQSVGWTGWAKGGTDLGTPGSGKRIEAIEVKIISAAQAEEMAAILNNTKLTYTAFLQGGDWQSYANAGETAGSIGTMPESIKVRLEGPSGLGIAVSAHIQSVGWTDFMSSDVELGTPGSGKRIEALKVQLTGRAASYLDVYYRVYVHGIGWLGWAKNGAPAGSSGISRAMEAYQIVLVESGGAAPGSTDEAFVQFDPGEKRYGWYEQNGKYYFFNRSTGEMQKGGTQAGITLNADGSAVMDAYAKEKLPVMVKAREVVASITDPDDTLAQKQEKCYQYVAKVPYILKLYPFKDYIDKYACVDAVYANCILNAYGNQDVIGGDCSSMAAALAYLYAELDFGEVYFCCDGDGNHGFLTADGYYWDPLFVRSKGRKYYKATTYELPAKYSYKVN